MKRRALAAGNREYIETLLSAQRRVHIQKGQFHQLMHHLGAIYSQFYGGFMEAMQLASGFKCITGDPVKKGYQVHHIFAKALYDGCNTLMLRSFCSGEFLEPVTLCDLIAPKPYEGYH